MGQSFYSEEDKHVWRGVRPAVVGDYVDYSGVAINNTATLITVPTDKILLVAQLFCNAYATVTGRGNMRIQIGANVHYPFMINDPSIHVNGSNSINLWPFIELSEGDTIKLNSATADVAVYGSVFGYLCDV